MVQRCREMVDGRSSAPRGAHVAGAACAVERVVMTYAGCGGRAIHRTHADARNRIGPSARRTPDHRRAGARPGRARSRDHGGMATSVSAGRSGRPLIFGCNARGQATSRAAGARRAGRVRKRHVGVAWPGHAGIVPTGAAAEPAAAATSGLSAPEEIRNAPAGISIFGRHEERPLR
jgi:hypothetical protein